jgi:hypothetical protein
MDATMFIRNVGEEQVIWIFQSHYGSGVDSASDRYEYQISSWGGEKLGRSVRNSAICELRV